jgi:hypothetical protein
MDMSPYTIMVSCLFLELLEKLNGARLKNGAIDAVGQILLEWFPQLHCMVSYCANLSHAKALYDYKKQTDPVFVDFLDVCHSTNLYQYLK